MLRALAVEPGRHRGVAVVDDDVADAELDTMHACGVRGVRLNLVSPVGESRRTGAALCRAGAAPAPAGLARTVVRERREMPSIAELHRHGGLTCVLDHLAGFGARVAADHPAWQAVEALAAQGAWLKLSGWYRLDAQRTLQRSGAADSSTRELFGERMVWGSDWPHTMFAADAIPSYLSTWRPVVDALGREGAEALQRRRPAIYH